MSDKNLTELEWKKFSKGKNFKDAAFVKALAALEKARDPGAKLAALDEIEKQADVLRKANKADKELTSYLDDTDKAASKDRKLAEFEAKKAAAAAKKDDSGDDEEETPTLLTTQMIPLLRQVKKGDVMHALVATAGKDTAVLLSKRAIAPARRKLLQEYLGVSGGIKYAVGECIWEENAHTFVLQTQASGLARKIKTALLAQTELRCKVRVRGEDPADIDDDGEPVESEAQQQTQAEQTEQTEQSEQTEQTEQWPVPDELQARFESRMEEIRPRVLAALAAQSPEASKLRAVSGFADEKAAGANYRAALAAVDTLEKLLASVAIAPAPIGKVDYAKCRLAWEAAKKKVQAELQKLEQTILDEYRGAPGFDEISVKLRKLDTVLNDFAEDLSDTLDHALNEQDAAERQRYHREASGQIRKFLDRAANDPFIAQIESNPFVTIKAQATLVATLGTLAKLIA